MLIEPYLMTRLLVQSCSKTKNTVREPEPALNVYDGYFFKIINKAIDDEDLRSDFELRILSAKHGIIHPEDQITDYNRRMTGDRATAIRESVTNDIAESADDSNAEGVVLNVGRDYRPAVKGLDEQLDIPVTRITGSGIGEKGHTLRKFIRGQVDPSGVVE